MLDSQKMELCILLLSMTNLEPFWQLSSNAHSKKCHASLTCSISISVLLFICHTNTSLDYMCTKIITSQCKGLSDQWVQFEPSNLGDHQTLAQSRRPSTDYCRRRSSFSTIQRADCPQHAASKVMQSGFRSLRSLALVLRKLGPPEVFLRNLYVGTKVLENGLGYPCAHEPIHPFEHFQAVWWHHSMASTWEQSATNLHSTPVQWGSTSIQMLHFYN